MYIQIILNLMIVIGLICIYMFITWKLKGIKNSKNQLIEVLSILGIGAKEKIMLLKVEGKKVLVGVTANNITVLTSIDAANDNLDTAVTSSFAEKLNEANNHSLIERNVL